jgi:hypothetical protein
VNVKRNEPTDSAPKVLSKYVRIKELYSTSYEEAVKLADNLFKPFGEKDASGSRTSKLAKVRIKASKKNNTFKVVLFRVRGKEKEVKNDTEDNTTSTSTDERSKTVSRNSGRPRRRGRTKRKDR